MKGTQCDQLPSDLECVLSFLCCVPIYKTNQILISTDTGRKLLQAQWGKDIRCLHHKSWVQISELELDLQAA